MRGDGESVECVAGKLHVTEKTVSVWTTACLRNGIDGILPKNKGRVVSMNGIQARSRLPELAETVQEDAGIRLGRWAVDSLRLSLAGEGIRVSCSTVRRILHMSRYVWKMPKLRAPGSIRKGYRRRKIVENYKRIAPALRAGGIAVYPEDEKWMELLPKLQCVWVKKGSVVTVPTPGYTERWYYFISMDYTTGTILWNSFARRRHREFRIHLSNLAAHMRREGIRKAILFMDMASYHDTPEVNRFLERHPGIVVKQLPRKDPNFNPVELPVNRRMAYAVQCSICYCSREELREAGSQFLSHFNAQYAVA